MNNTSAKKKKNTTSQKINKDSGKNSQSHIGV